MLLYKPYKYDNLQIKAFLISEIFGKKNNI